MKINPNHKQAGTHIPTLLKVIPLTTGDVCEMGAGFYSTPILHWLCQGRNLVTYESDIEYYRYARQFQSWTHKIKKVEDWSEADYNRHWSVVFIDHTSDRGKNPHRRGDDTIKFTNADIIILHDTEPDVRNRAGEKDHYGYEQVWAKFKYRYDWKECLPYTSVVSNVIDVSKWNL
jgi:hypothetical protein